MLQSDSTEVKHQSSHNIHIIEEHKEEMPRHPYQVLQELPPDATPAQQDSALQTVYSSTPNYKTATPLDSTSMLNRNNLDKNLEKVDLPQYYRQNFFSTDSLRRPSAIYDKERQYDYRIAPRLFHSGARGVLEVEMVHNPSGKKLLQSATQRYNSNNGDDKRVPLSVLPCRPDLSVALSRYVLLCPGIQFRHLLRVVAIPANSHLLRCLRRLLHAEGTSL